MDAGVPDDYYALLGVEDDADAEGLRRAWRRLALQWHPDRAGPGATATFQKIFAAYTVLSDPAARAVYDRRRGTRARLAAAKAAAEAPPAPRRAPGVMLSRLSGPLNALFACGVARRAEDDVIELLLGAKDAEQGGVATIAMRVAAHCSECAGDTSVECGRCGSQRTTEELFSAWLSVPPGVEDGTILLPSVQLRGAVKPVRFRVRLR